MSLNTKQSVFPSSITFANPLHYNCNVFVITSQSNAALSYAGFFGANGNYTHAMKQIRANYTPAMEQNKANYTPAMKHFPSAFGQGNNPNPDLHMVV